MSPYNKKYIETLKKSLFPIARETDSLDWKMDLSPKKERLRCHLSAFANLTSGGILVFGVDEGKCKGVTAKQANEILEVVTNLSRDGLSPAVNLKSEVIEYEGVFLLFIEVLESEEKPVCLRGKSIEETYIRSTGTTRKANKGEIKNLILRSKTPDFEKRPALSGILASEIGDLIYIKEYFQLLKKEVPTVLNNALLEMTRDNILIQTEEKYQITNLGALLFAKDLKNFPNLANKGTRILVYEESGKTKAIKDRQAQLGYAIGLPRLLKYIMDLLPVSETVQKAVRVEVKLYPELALRELLANALIHQDLEAVGTQPRIEIFNDRLEISNPGRSLIEPLRMIDGCQSRNEKLASMMNRLGYCEERGKGIDEVILEIEKFQLPPPEFIQSDSHTKVILYSKRKLTQMSKTDRIRACFQHCSLRYVFHKETNNQSIRERFGISEANKSQASRIIKDTIQAGYIEQEDPTSKSKKYLTYVPFWARSK
jgi:ATP-dependent DNA helicase RecG